MSGPDHEEPRSTGDRRRTYFWIMEALVAVPVIGIFLIVTEGEVYDWGDTLIGLAVWIGIAVSLSAPFALLALNFRLGDARRPLKQVVVGTVRLLAGALWAVVGFGVAFILGVVGTTGLH